MEQLSEKQVEDFNKDLKELCEKHGVTISAEFTRPQIVVRPKEEEPKDVADTDTAN